MQTLETSAPPPATVMATSYPVDMSTNTSAQALQRMGLKKIAGMQAIVLEICLSAQRNGALDLSSREIQALYEQQYGKRIEAATIAARVNGLVSAHRLERVREGRPCSVTGIEIHPVRVPMTQARLVG